MDLPCFAYRDDELRALKDQIRNEERQQIVNNINNLVEKRKGKRAPFAATETIKAVGVLIARGEL